jgi:hypothetical protein
MGIESATSIATLDASWPLVGDKRSEGDDHLRLIKNVLKLMFPGAGGVGFATPITAKEVDLNAVFTTGVKAAFYLAAAPTGWTIANPGTNYTLVSAAIGGTVTAGNGNIVTGCTLVPDHVHTQQGTFVSGLSTQSLSHSHAINGGTVQTVFDASLFNGVTTGGGSNNFIKGTSIGTVNAASTDLIAHNHNVTISGFTSGNSSGNAGNWQPAYATVIIASKN